jgi:hypothetical protein
LPAPYYDYASNSPATSRSWRRKGEVA